MMDKISIRWRRKGSEGTKAWSWERGRYEERNLGRSAAGEDREMTVKLVWLARWNPLRSFLTEISLAEVLLVEFVGLLSLDPLDPRTLGSFYERRTLNMEWRIEFRSQESGVRMKKAMGYRRRAEKTNVEHRMGTRIYTDKHGSKNSKIICLRPKIRR